MSGSEGEGSPTEAKINPQDLVQALAKLIIDLKPDQLLQLTRVANNISEGSYSKEGSFAAVQKLKDETNDIAAVAKVTPKFSDKDKFDIYNKCLRSKLVVVPNKHLSITLTNEEGVEKTFCCLEDADCQEGFPLCTPAAVAKFHSHLSEGERRHRDRLYSNVLDTLSDRMKSELMFTGTVPEDPFCFIANMKVEHGIHGQNLVRAAMHAEFNLSPANHLTLKDFVKQVPIVFSGLERAKMKRNDEHKAFVICTALCKVPEHKKMGDDFMTKNATYVEIMRELSNKVNFRRTDEMRLIGAAHPTKKIAGFGAEGGGKGGGNDSDKKKSDCNYWKRGKCNRGDKCTYKHSKEKKGVWAKKKGDNGKKPMCRIFANTGKCPYGDNCKFAHVSNPNVGSTQQQQITTPQTNFQMPAGQFVVSQQDHAFLAQHKQNQQRHQSLMQGGAGSGDHQANMRSIRVMGGTTFFPQPNKWNLDTGAEADVCVNPSLAENMRLTPVPCHLRGPSGKETLVEYECDVKVPGTDLIAKGVACAFDWKSERNFLSLAKLCKSGCGILIHPHTAVMEVIEQGKVLHSGKLVVQVQCVKNSWNIGGHKSKIDPPAASGKRTPAVVALKKVGSEAHLFSKKYLSMIFAQTRGSASRRASSKRRPGSAPWKGHC